MTTPNLHCVCGHRAAAHRVGTSMGLTGCWANSNTGDSSTPCPCRAYRRPMRLGEAPAEEWEAYEQARRKALHGIVGGPVTVSGGEPAVPQGHGGLVRDIFKDGPSPELQARLDAMDVLEKLYRSLDDDCDTSSEERDALLRLVPDLADIVRCPECGQDLPNDVKE